MPDDKSDVLIAGAGPAGLAAAITCARAGLRTCLISKKPATGDFGGRPLQSLHPRAEPLLQELGAASALEVSVVARFDSIHSKTSAQSFSPYAALEVYGYHVERSRFDEGLLACARDSGVQVFPDSAVADVIVENARVAGVRTRQGNQLRAHAVIDATGYARVLGRRLGAMQRNCSPPLIVRTGIINTDDNNHTHGPTRFEARSGGWSWFTQATNNKMTWAALHSRSGAGSPEIADLVRRSTPGSVRTSDARWRLTRPLAISGMLVVGEAAGRLDPAWGLGIVNAMESGQKAAHAVIDAAATPALAPWLQAEYDAWFVANFEEAAEQLRSYYIQQGITILSP